MQMRHAKETVGGGGDGRDGRGIFSDERTGGFTDEKPLFLLAGQDAKDGVR